VNEPTDLDRDELRAALSLAEGFEIPLRQRVLAVRETGNCTTALARLSPKAKPASARTLASAQNAVQRGYRLLCLTDREYPRLLNWIPDPPLVLTVWGELRAEDGLAIAVVGSRRATPYGLDACRRLARELASAGLTIVSGLARGIDAEAHRGALDAGGRTIAVLGSGLSNLYPKEHRRLAELVATSGAVLTEFPLDEPPRAQNFPRRNRIITGMTLGTLVVEAAAKSGSLVSARLALDQNREVFAVPGPIGSRNRDGVHALIRDGATLVERGADVIGELRPELRALLRAPGGATGEAVEGDLDEDERSVLGRLKETERALDLDELLEGIALTVDRALAALCRLEVKGAIWRLPGGLFQKKGR
jgi:DNA processing protein